MRARDWKPAWGWHELAAGGGSSAVPSGKSESKTIQNLLQAIEISKRFPGVLALDRVNFDLAHGEIHVFFGENGAGKSTLINVIAGTYLLTAGA